MGDVMKVPQGGRYDDALYECSPVSKQTPVKKPADESTSCTEPKADGMCMQRPEPEVWCSLENHAAKVFAQSRARFEKQLAGDLKRIWDAQNARMANIDPDEQVAMLKEDMQEPTPTIGDFFGNMAKIVALPFAIFGSGCVMRSPYLGIRTSCEQVKVDHYDKAENFFVLARNQIESLCRQKKRYYISKTASTRCREKDLFEQGKLTTNPNWSEGMARAVFDAVGQYYVERAVGYEIKDWRPLVKKIPVYFQDCSVAKQCAASIVVCLNAQEIQMLTKAKKGGETK